MCESDWRKELRRLQQVRVIWKENICREKFERNNFEGKILRESYMDGKIRKEQFGGRNFKGTI
jgi:hypothetical protein